MADMTVAERNAPVVLHPPPARTDVSVDDKLAVQGGPKAVRGRWPERWRQMRWRDILAIARWARRDVNTLIRGGPI